MQIPFQWHDRDGLVNILYCPNTNPSRWDYDVLDMPELLTAAVGFPVIHATVQYPAEGYRGVMGWIQIIRPGIVTAAYEDLVPQLTGTGAYNDLAPQLIGTAIPFYSYGHLPSLFDAPSTTDIEDREWVAHSYLVASPDGPMTKYLTWLAGMRWGYHISKGVPIPADLTVLDASDWGVDAGLLSQWYPGWTFKA